MIVVRRIVGESMSPNLPPGKLVIGLRWPRRIRQGDVVIVSHNGLEKIKRLAQIHDDEIFVLGDNLLASKDSRHFGWLKRGDIAAKVIWPITV